MPSKERRAQQKANQAKLKAELNAAQLETLRDLEMFGWELKFIRHRPFQPITPVVFDGDRKKFAVLDPDGRLNENPGFTIR